MKRIERDEILDSKTAICRFLKIGPKNFQRWLDAGLPVSKEGNRYMGTANVMNAWVAEYLARKGKAN